MPNQAPEEFTGQCQCGSVQYRVRGKALTLFACHCSECQRQSASAFGMALWVEQTEVQLLQGQLKRWVRALPSGGEMACDFCPECGSRLFHQKLGQDKIISIKPGSLHDTRWLKPVAHIWTNSQQPWLQLDPNTLHYPQNPDSLAAILAAWEHG